jgi:hypothetical protein
MSELSKLDHGSKAMILMYRMFQKISGQVGPAKQKH